MIKSITSLDMMKVPKYKEMSYRYFGEDGHIWGKRNINIIARFIAEFVGYTIELEDVKLNGTTYEFFYKRKNNFK